MHGTEFYRCFKIYFYIKIRIFNILFLMQLTMKIIIIEEIIEIFISVILPDKRSVSELCFWLMIENNNYYGNNYGYNYYGLLYYYSLL